MLRSLRVVQKSNECSFQFSSDSPSRIAPSLWGSGATSILRVFSSILLCRFFSLKFLNLQACVLFIETIKLTLAVPSWACLPPFFEYEVCCEDDERSPFRSQQHKEHTYIKYKRHKALFFFGTRCRAGEEKRRRGRRYN